MSSSEHNQPAAAKSTGRDKEGLSKTSSGVEPSSNTGKTKGWGRRDDGGWGVFGGYMAAKKQKLDSQFNTDHGQVSNIFEGISIYINGYTNPSSDELRRLIMEHGGRNEQYLMKTRVTHIIATNLPDSKVRDLRDMKVVQPEWILDSIKAGRLLSHAPYKLFTSQGNTLDSFSTVITRSSKTVSHVTEQSSSASKIFLEKKHQDQVKCSHDGSEVETSARGHNGDEISDSTEQSYDADAFDRETERIHQPLSPVGPSDYTSDQSLTDILPSINKHGEQTHVNPPKTSSSSGLLQDKGKSPVKAGDPNFLFEFYSHSRLHHISTWGAEFRAYVSKLQKESRGHFPGRNKLREFHMQKMVERGFAPSLESSKCGKHSKVIMHIDMDCFFVSVGLLSHPEYKDKPVAVTHSRGKGLTEPIPGSDYAFERSNWRNKKVKIKKPSANVSVTNTETGSYGQEEDLMALTLESHAEVDILASADIPGKHSFQSMAEIASCSYEARKTGVKNGMLMGEARQLCPELVTIPYDFEGYNRVSRCLYNTVASYTHDIEAVSCDEMLVDCTDLLADTGTTPLEFSELLRKDIVEKTGCTASAGLGSNILLARLATRCGKPNGQFHLLQDEVMDFMKMQSVKDLPGVGWSMSKKLNAMGLMTCEDLQKISVAALQKEFGPKTGQTLYKFCRGEDDRLIRTEKERKSVSAEINYGIRFQSDGEAVKFVEELAAEVSSRLHSIGRKGRTLTLKLMVRRSDAPLETAKFMGHGICNSMSKSSTLPLATDSPDLLGKEAVGLLRAMKVNSVDLRGIGIQVHRLETATFGSATGLASKGNQSILNFAVARQEVSEKASECHSKAAQSAGNETQEKNFESVSDRLNSKMQHQSVVYHGSAADQMSRIKCREENSKEMLPPLPCLLGLADKRPSSKEIIRGERAEFLLSPSQVDPNVLQELPSDIRQQIEEEIKKSRNPSHCCTSTRRVSSRKPADISKPGCSHWATPPDEPVEELPEDQGIGRKAAETLNISFSQIDPDVLSELPDDVRTQLEEEMAAAKRLRKRSETQAPQSHVMKRWDKDGADRQQKDHKDVICALPSPSQLDPSCLEALPRSLQDEITAAYSKQELVRQQGHCQLHSPTKSHPLPSGRSRGSGRGRGRSRGQGGRPRGKGSPLFKVPQGKPAVNSSKMFAPKQLDFRKETNILQMNTSSVNVDAMPQLPSVTKENNISLCGAVTLAEVRALLSEWLESTGDPQDQDIEELVKYLGQLVLDSDLEMVDLILKFLHRKTSIQKVITWKTSFQNILQHTQDIVKSVYGSNLKTDWLSRTY